MTPKKDSATFVIKFPSVLAHEDTAQNYTTNFNSHFCGLNCLRASPRPDSQLPYQQRQSIITKKQLLSIMLNELV